MMLNIIDRFPALLRNSIGGILFLSFAVLGILFILVAKVANFPTVMVTAVPVVILVAYASLLLFARFFRLRDDQAGDNIYYLGFLYTLTSLAVALYKFSGSDSPESIVQNFGVAISSTIAGIALRVFFNQMRRDPIETEQAARLELAEAARRVKQELDSTVLELSFFRRATQQSLSDGFEEMEKVLQKERDVVLTALKELPASIGAPLAAVSKDSIDTISQAGSKITKIIDNAAGRLSRDADKLADGTQTIAQSLDILANKLGIMQTPDKIIQVELRPLIEHLSQMAQRVGHDNEKSIAAVTGTIEVTERVSNSLRDSIAASREIGMLIREATAALASQGASLHATATLVSQGANLYAEVTARSQGADGVNRELGVSLRELRETVASLSAAMTHATEERHRRWFDWG